MKYKVKITGFKFGVPMGFLGYKYNAEQFRLIGLGLSELGRSIGVGATITAAEWPLLRAKNNKLRKGTLFIRGDDSNYIVPYARVLIKFK